MWNLNNLAHNLELSPSSPIMTSSTTCIMFCFIDNIGMIVANARNREYIWILVKFAILKPPYSRFSHLSTDITHNRFQLAGLNQNKVTTSLYRLEWKWPLIEWQGVLKNMNFIYLTYFRPFIISIIQPTVSPKELFHLTMYKFVFAKTRAGITVLNYINKMKVNTC